MTILDTRCSVCTPVQETGEVIYGMLNMVDLAGSERLKKSESDGQRLKEALHINSSLSAVGKVVMSLDPESGYNYIPYRDSKLTRLLQNSIGTSTRLFWSRSASLLHSTTKTDIDEC